MKKHIVKMNNGEEIELSYDDGQKLINAFRSGLKEYFVEDLGVIIFLAQVNTMRLHDIYEEKELSSLPEPPKNIIVKEEFSLKVEDKSNPSEIHIGKSIKKHRPLKKVITTKVPVICVEKEYKWDVYGIFTKYGTTTDY